MQGKWLGADKGAVKLIEAISILTNQNQELVTFLFDPNSPRLRKRAGILREDAWKFSEEDQLLVRVALDLWSGSGHVQVWELVEAWDTDNWQRFNQAVLHFTSTDKIPR